MEEFYYDFVTFLGGLDFIVKILIVGMLAILVFMSVKSVIKTHVNPKKPIFKIGQFILLAILLAITIFICINVF